MPATSLGSILWVRVRLCLRVTRFRRREGCPHARPVQVWSDQATADPLRPPLQLVLQLSVMQLPQGSTADSKGSLAKLDNQRHRDN
eukprot:7841660-Pyramimonas_sp.AAC.2